MPEQVPDSAGKYTSIPTTITAIQWTGDNIHALWDWCGADNVYGPVPTIDDADHNQNLHAKDVEMRPARLYVAANDAWLDLEIGEWILKDDLGFYPCKHAVFIKKYAPADGSGILVIPPALAVDLSRVLENITLRQRNLSIETVSTGGMFDAEDLPKFRVTTVTDVYGDRKDG